MIETHRIERPSQAHLATEEQGERGLQTVMELLEEARDNIKRMDSDPEYRKKIEDQIV